MSVIFNTKNMHPRDQICVIMQKLYDRRLTTTSGGNISVIDESGDIWITPTGVDKGVLKSSDIVCLRRDGTIVGKHKPSSEVPFHKAIYETCPHIKAILHAHSPALVAFSITRQIPNTNIISQTNKVCGKIGYAEYKLPGTAELGDGIAKEFMKGNSAVIMENHGIVVGGDDMLNTFQRFETLEFSAQTILYGKQIGEPEYLSNAIIRNYEQQLPEPFAEMSKVFYPSDEKEKRLEICKIAERAFKQGLMLSSGGSISTRWVGNDFLITPSNIPSWNLGVGDIVQIKEGKKEKGKEISRNSYLHQEIYNRHKEINSIIITQPSYLMAFAVTNSIFNVRTIPESWIYLQDVRTFKFGSHFPGATEIYEGLSPENPAFLIKNDCAVVAGNKLLQTFDFLEVAEFSAKSLVMSAVLGKMIPINEEQVKELQLVMSKWKNYDWNM